MARLFPSFNCAAWGLDPPHSVPVTTHELILILTEEVAGDLDSCVGWGKLAVPCL